MKLTNKKQQQLLQKDYLKQETNKVVSKANALHKESETIKQDHFQRTYEALYKVCEKVYTLYEEANKDEKVLGNVIQVMKKELKNRKIKVQANSTKATIFVRYVFGNDRKTAWTYGNAIEAALEANVKPNNFLSFMKKSGGVTAASKKEKVELLTEDLSDYIYSIKSNHSFSMVTCAADSSTSLVFLVARKSKNGNLEILRSVEHNQAMLDRAYKELLKDMKENKTKAKANVISKKIEDVVINASKVSFNSKTSNKANNDAEMAIAA